MPDCFIITSILNRGICLVCSVWKVTPDMIFGGYMMLVIWWGYTICVTAFDMQRKQTAQLWSEGGGE